MNIFIMFIIAVWVSMLITWALYQWNLNTLTDKEKYWYMLLDLTSPEHSTKMSKRNMRNIARSIEKDYAEFVKQQTDDAVEEALRIINE